MLGIFGGPLNHSMNGVFSSCLRDCKLLWRLIAIYNMARFEDVGTMRLSPSMKRLVDSNSVRVFYAQIGCEEGCFSIVQFIDRRSDAMYDLIVQYLYVPWERGKGTLSSVPLIDP